MTQSYTKKTLTQTHKHIYTVNKRKRKNTQNGKIRISLHHKTKFT